MTTAEARQLRAVDYLASLGYHPQGVTSKQYWYSSPLHNERTPSFKVNDRFNKWYDFSIAMGRDLVELGKHLYRTDSVSEVLACVGKHENAIPIQRIRVPGATPRFVGANMKDMLIIPLQRHALLSYLHSRGVDGDIGCMFCREVHYELRQRCHFALTFGNVTDEYEIRNLYYKGCIRCKDISAIGHSHSEARNRVCVFESFMDFPSYLTLKQTGDGAVCIDTPCDYLVMNSVNNLREALEHLQIYKEIRCYLDNNLAEQKAEETIADMYGRRVHSETLRYHEYKDLSNYLRGKKR